MRVVDQAKNLACCWRLFLWGILLWPLCGWHAIFCFSIYFSKTATSYARKSVIFFLTSVTPWSVFSPSLWSLPFALFFDKLRPIVAKFIISCEDSKNYSGWAECRRRSGRSYLCLHRLLMSIIFQLLSLSLLSELTFLPLRSLFML